MTTEQIRAKAVVIPQPTVATVGTDTTPAPPSPSDAYLNAPAGLSLGTSPKSAVLALLGGSAALMAMATTPFLNDRLPDMSREFGESLAQGDASLGRDDAHRLSETLLLAIETRYPRTFLSPETMIEDEFINLLASGAGTTPAIARRSLEFFFAKRISRDIVNIGLRKEVPVFLALATSRPPDRAESELVRRLAVALMGRSDLYDRSEAFLRERVALWNAFPEKQKDDLLRWAPGRRAGLVEGVPSHFLNPATPADQLIIQANREVTASNLPHLAFILAKRDAWFASLPFEEKQMRAQMTLNAWRDVPETDRAAMLETVMEADRSRGWGYLNLVPENFLMNHLLTPLERKLRPEELNAAAAAAFEAARVEGPKSRLRLTDTILADVLERAPGFGDYSLMDQYELVLQAHEHWEGLGSTERDEFIRLHGGGSMESFLSFCVDRVVTRLPPRLLERTGTIRRGRR